MKMQAAVVTEAGKDYEIKDLIIKEPTKNEVLVKVVAAGICNTDHSSRMNPLNSFPRVLGHEGSGIVEAIGDSVNDLEVGDHVVLSYAYCAECPSCRSGHPADCEKMLVMNFTGKSSTGDIVIHDEDGNDVYSYFNQSSFATYSLVDRTNVVKVSKKHDLRKMGPLTCGLTTGSGAVFNLLKPEPGSTMAVFGAGAVGYASIMSAKIFGCSKIIAVDINEKRLEMAKELGATHVINSSENPETVVEQIKELTGGKGVNYTIDTTGVPLVIKQALVSLANSGSFVALAISKQATEINTYTDLLMGNKKMYGILMGDTIPQDHITNLIDFYERGLFPYDKLIDFYDFEDIVQAEEDAVTGKSFKSVLVIDKTYQP